MEELLAKKFKTVGELENAYGMLQAAFTKKCQQCRHLEEQVLDAQAVSAQSGDTQAASAQVMDAQAQEVENSGTQTQGVENPHAQAQAREADATDLTPSAAPGARAEKDLYPRHPEDVPEGTLDDAKREALTLEEARARALALDEERAKALALDEAKVKALAFDETKREAPAVGSRPSVGEVSAEELLEALRLQAVSEYLQQVLRGRAPAVLHSGGTPVTAPQRPKDFDEAGRLARRMFGL